MVSMPRTLFKTFFQFCFLLAGLGLLAVAATAYRFGLQTLRIDNYSLFDTKKTISWAETENGIYRRVVKGQLDNKILSEDPWRDYTFSFTLVSPKDGGIIFNYRDENNHDFVYFKQTGGGIVGGRVVAGKKEILKSVLYNFQFYQDCVLQVEKGAARFSIDGQPMFELIPGEDGGRLGLVVNDAGRPPLLFNKVSINGRLENGQKIVSHIPRQMMPHEGRHQILPFLPFYASIVFLSVYFSLFLRRWQRKDFVVSLHPHMIAAGASVLFAVFFFWPFLRQGQVAIFSYDNIGEIFPLFFYSKHNFERILNGQGHALWNPLIHNGFPFFSNHWDMIYYPFNWPVFLFPGHEVMTALTWKAFFEVSLIGILAYGFFARELGSRGWALFSSVVYQTGSILIFTMSIFPSLSLYFAMTLYLYLLWSLSDRRAVVNFMVITFAAVLILTSANVAFIFYAVLSLAVITLYRLLSLKGGGLAAFGWVALSWVTAFLIAAVRILSCLEGVAGSNRIVENYHTLHDRAFMVIRLFLPEIAGWLGPDALPVLTSGNLRLIFEDLGLPMNPHNTFFIYCGVIPAVLLLVNFFIKTRGGHAFWKSYAGATIAVALLLQPFWGILSILSFPFKHYSYHVIIVPVGVAALVGHTGLYLQQMRSRLSSGGSSFKKLGRSLILTLFLIQAYILVFLTYLFPNLTDETRLIFLIMGLGWAGYFCLKTWARPWVRPFLTFGSMGFSGLVLTLLILATSFVILNPLPRKGGLAEEWLAPLLWIFAAAGMGLWRYLAVLAPGQEAGDQDFKKGMRLRIGDYLPLVGALIVAMMFSSSEMWIRWLQEKEQLRVYGMDVVLGHLRLFLLISAGLAAFVLLRLNVLPRRLIVGLLIVLTALDLAAFNARFNGIAAPFFYSQAFYPKEFSYQPPPQDLIGRMDLVNYRVSHLHLAGFNANKNLIAGLPTYSGTVGYLTKRFHKFVTAFGYPEGIYLIYPEDLISSDRFLDLSAVRYVFEDETTITSRPSALARLNLFYSYEVVGDEKLLLQRLQDATFVPQQKALLARHPQIIIPPLVKSRPARAVPIARADSDIIEATVGTDTPALLVFNESYDAGWKVFVDNRETPVLIANYNFMACPISAGTHQVRFHYQPLTYARNLKLSLGGLVLFLLVVVLSFMFSLKRERMGIMSFKNGFMLLLGGVLAASSVACSDLRQQIVYQRAKTYHDGGKYDKAITLYKELIERDPDGNVSVRYDLGVAYADLLDFDSAADQVEALKKADREDLASVLEELIARGKAVKSQEE